MSTNSLRKLFGIAKPPKKITQQTVVCDPSHLVRLIDVQKKPSAMDLYTYIEDIAHQPIQLDLFKFLFPICLDAWRTEFLAEEGTPFAGFCEQFVAVLANRRCFEEMISDDQFFAVSEFMKNTILERIQNTTLVTRDSSRDKSRRIYSWLPAVVAHGVIFPNLEALWNIWWSIDSPSKAYAVLTFVSALIYDKDHNPIFKPWTPLHGGGPPSLIDTAAFIFEGRWRKENIEFLKSRLNVEYIKGALDLSLTILAGAEAQNVARKMLADVSADVDKCRRGSLNIIVCSMAISVMRWGLRRQEYLASEIIFR